MGWENRLAGDKQPQTFNNVSLTPPPPAHTAQTNDQTKSQETRNFKQSFNCSHWDKVRRPLSARGCWKQTEKCNSSWVVAQTGSRGAAVACWELEAMAAPGPWRLGCCRWKGASVGGAVDLLTGGDHLAILDFLHNGPHLAGGHRACGRRGRDTHRTSGWRPSLSPPHRRGLSLSPPALGRLLPSRLGCETREEEYWVDRLQEEGELSA